jgi:hypothetical protein
MRARGTKSLLFAYSALEYACVSHGALFHETMTGILKDELGSLSAVTNPSADQSAPKKRAIKRTINLNIDQLNRE